MNYWLIFLTGLTTGGISCAAVQGGLLASLIANQKASKASPLLMGFLGAKLIAYTLVGGILGAIGSVFQINQSMILFFQTLAALYLIASALNLLDVHPLFRYTVIQPPKAWFKLAKTSSRMQQWFAPIMLGTLTILIPCGVTQAMEITAISSGNPLTGGMILFSFVLGTMPLFILIGLGLKSLSAYRQQLLYKAAAALLIILGLSSLNGVAIALDLPVSTSAISTAYHRLRVYESGSAPAPNIPVVDGAQQVTITIGSHGYTPKFVQVKKGIPVKLTLKTESSYSCANYFTFRAFNIAAQLGPDDTQQFTFIPEKTGQYSFSCSMGMYSGTMEVVD